ncbi:site-specific integrase [Pseudomonas aeruginosa]|nr:site-specific integrase [Pseudomonas aeruginosa]MCS9497610.1 site-specific integrase [Pseudomonas aeruginosa]MCS9603456.1 site-specific integrase [Pseudomonas aeruginosa]MCT1296440.1 site-specific integrase [Pseudomonas aeruginosa]
MKPSPSYLTRNRHGTFYFRIVIPRPLRALLNGQREVRRTLRTDSERLARRRARQFAARYEAVFDKVVSVLERDELGLTDADYEEAIALGLIPDDKTRLDFSSPQDGSQPAEPVLSEKEIEARQRRREVERLLTGAYGRPIPTELEPTAQQLLEHSRIYQPTELRTILPRLRDSLAQVKVADSANPATQPQAPSVDPAIASWTLYQVWQHQLERDRADKTAKGGQAKHGGTLEERERRARIMTVLTQHKPVCQLTKKDWQAAYDAARKMKAGAKASISPPTQLADLLTEDPGQMTGHERVSALIASMKQIQNYARHLDLTTIRPDDLIINPVQKRETPRTRGGKAFTMSEVETIFSGYIYQGALPPDRTKAYPFWFWLPLIGYFTGARTNEIAQLDTADIREIDGYPCFDFCSDNPKAFEAKRIKTNEDRQIPIHPRLIELGFLDYVEDQRRAKQKKLLGDGLAYLQPRNKKADHGKEGWAKDASKFFNEGPKSYLQKIGVHGPNDGKSIYSLRHTLQTNLADAIRDGKGIAQSTIDAITGHTPQTIAGKHYDRGATLQQKLEALKLLPIPEAIQNITSYQVNFVSRFGNILTKSIQSHRMRRSRTI